MSNTRTPVIPGTTTRPRADDSRSVRPSPSTRRLLAAGAAAGPVFALASWLQVATTDGSHITRHALSQLSLGPNGWIQTANLIGCGTMFLLGAAGLHRVLAGTRSGRWAARLLAGFAVSLVIAGLFPTDPAHGYPVGSTDHSNDPSWHAIVHATGPALGIVLAAAACLLFARRYATEHRRGPAVCSGVVAGLMFAPDAYRDPPAPATPSPWP
jgi:Protein of unknown function (DUF998)